MDGNKSQKTRFVYTAIKLREGFDETVLLITLAISCTIIIIAYPS